MSILQGQSSSTSSLPPPSTPPVPCSPELIKQIACRMHDCHHGGAKTGSWSKGMAYREKLDLDEILSGFLTQHGRFPVPESSKRTNEALLENFEILLKEKAQWELDDCLAWLDDYQDLLLLLNEEAKRIVSEANKDADEEKMEMEIRGSTAGGASDYQERRQRDEQGAEKP